MTLDSSDLGPLTQNAFLGGALTISQPVNGYRAGIDPVLLAAAVPAKPGDTLLDLGCGSGVAALCVGRRVPGLELYGLEIQPAYAKLARQNGLANSLPITVFEGSVDHAPQALRTHNFDHVIANPPYFSRKHGSVAQDAGRDQGRAGDDDLASWVSLARKRLTPGGTLTIVQDAARFPELMAAFQTGFGGISTLPISSRQGRAARLIIVQARKGSAASARLLAPLILHQGDRHVSDADDYSNETSAILRNAAPIHL